MLAVLAPLANARLTDAQPAQTLELGGSVSAQIDQQTALIYQISIPAETRSVSLQLSGCPTDSRAKNADGTANERVKAYASFTVAKPTVWDATWSMAWCEPRALRLERGQPGFPAPADDAPATLYVSVFAALQARFSLAVLDPSAPHELKLGRVLNLALHSSNTFEQATGRSYEVIARDEQNGFGETGVVLDTLSVRIPATTSAIVIRTALKSTKAAQTLLMPCKVAVLVSFTVQNLTALPASWGFELAADASGVERVIPRTSRAFCAGEPCVLTIQIRDREANHYHGRHAEDPESCAAPNHWDYCKCFVLDHDIGHRLEIGVSEVEASAAGVDAMEHYRTLRRVQTEATSGSTCAPGCEEHLVNDGVCHEACFTSACRHDGGDCYTPLKRTLDGLLSLPHVPPVVTGQVSPPNFGVGNARHVMELTPYCAAGCPDHWLHDRVCQDACFCVACGWDGDDCAELRGVQLTSNTGSEVAKVGVSPSGLSTND